jgi:hypothetical protein
LWQRLLQQGALDVGWDWRSALPCRERREMIRKEVDGAIAESPEFGG